MLGFFEPQIPRLQSEGESDVHPPGSLQWQV